MKRVRDAFNDMPIRVQLLVYYSGLFFVVMIIAGILLYSMARKTLEANIENELSNSTGAILNMVQSAVDTAIRNHLRSVAEKNLEITQYFYDQYRRSVLTEEEAKARAKEVLSLQTIGKTGYIYCIDSAGTMQVHPSRELLGANLISHAFVKAQTLRKEGYLEYDWANPGETAARPKALYMTWFQPWDWIISVSSHRDEFLDLIDIDDFRQGVLAMTFGRTGYSYVMDTTGTLIIHPKLQGTNIFGFRDTNGRMFIRDICKKRNGKMTYPWVNPGEDRPRLKLTIFNHIPELDWIVASTSYLEEFYKPLLIIKYAIIGTLLVLLILLLPITFRISESITRPVQELMKGFSTGACGDYSFRMPHHRGDEIGRLAGYYNTFMERLADYSHQLSASEEKYRSIYENSLEGIFQTTQEGRFLSANNAMASILGYPSAESLIGEVMDIPRQLYVNPEDREEIFRILATDGEVEGFETRFYRKDKEIIWVSLNTRWVLSESGDNRYLQGFITDIGNRKRTEEALRESERRMAGIIDFLPNAMLAIDINGRVIAWNRAMEEMTGLRAEEIIGHGNYEYAIPFYGTRRPILANLVLSPDPASEKKYDILRREEKVLIAEMEVTGLDGEPLFLWGKASPIFDSRGNIVGAIESLRDITATKRAEADQLKSRSELEHRVQKRTAELSEWIGELTKRNEESALLREMSEMLQVCFKAEETYPIISRFIERFFPGYPGGIFIHTQGQPPLFPAVAWGDAADPQEAFCLEACWALRQGKPYRVMAADRHLSCGHIKASVTGGYLCVPMMTAGELMGLFHIRFPAELSELPQERKLRRMDRDEQLAATIVEHLSLALTNLKLRETLRLQSIIDPLTGLYNRRHMNEVLEREAARAIRHGSPLGIIMLDVDHFKRFNDTHGHDAGDAVLRELGAFLRIRSRREDIVFRYGGEEFVILLIDTSHKMTLSKAEELCRSIREKMPIDHGGKMLNITISLGVSVYPVHGDTTAKALKAADEALYRAKTQGRNRVASAGDELAASVVATTVSRKENALPAGKGLRLVDPPRSLPD